MNCKRSARDARPIWNWEHCELGNLTKERLYAAVG